MKPTLTVLLAVLAVIGCRDTRDPAGPTLMRAPGAAAAVIASNDLGTLDGGWCSPRAINGTGVVAGTVGLPSGVSRGFVSMPGSPLQALALSDRQSVANDVNAKGVVAGAAQLTTGAFRAYFWTVKGGVRELPILGNPADSRMGSNAVAINTAGQMVGWSSDAKTGQAHAVIWQPDLSITDVSAGALSATGWADAYAINERGTVVGIYTPTSSSSSRAFIWLEGRFRDIGGLSDAGPTLALSVNNRNQVVGYSFTKDNQQHAFLWDERTGMVDLGTLGGSSSAGRINDQGEVVGASEVSPGTYHAFHWSDATGMVDLGAVGSNSGAADINESHQIVGTASGADGVARAAAWNGGKPLIRLPGLTTLHSSANAINEAGQAVGASKVSSFEAHCVVWTVPLGVVNQDPIANAGGPYSGIAGTAITLNASASSDPDEDALTYNWDFGDGSTADNAGPTPSHVYGSAGSYTATVTVDDGNGGTNSASAAVTVLSPSGAAAALGDAVEALLTGGSIPPTIAGPLVSSADNASASLAKGNTTGATGQLSAFINKVESAVKNGKITQADGDKLIAFAQQVLSSIGS